MADDRLKQLVVTRDMDELLSTRAHLSRSFARTHDTRTLYAVDAKGRGQSGGKARESLAGLAQWPSAAVTLTIAEVDTVAKIETPQGAREIVGRIDRFAVTEEEILIADFKNWPPTRRTPALGTAPARALSRRGG